MVIRQNDLKCISLQNKSLVQVRFNSTIADKIALLTKANIGNLMTVLVYKNIMVMLAVTGDAITNIQNPAILSIAKIQTPLDGHMIAFALAPENIEKFKTEINQKHKQCKL